MKEFNPLLDKYTVCEGIIKTKKHNVYEFEFFTIGYFNQFYGNFKGVDKPYFCFVYNIFLYSKSLNGIKALIRDETCIKGFKWSKPNRIPTRGDVEMELRRQSTKQDRE